MASLVTTVKRDFGATYSPQAAADLAAGIRAPFSDASEVFLHGLLNSDRNCRWGTCTSIPVLIASVARRLGYPVGLAVNRRHVYARWDNGVGTQFNIEASNPMGMTSESDDHYRNWPTKLTPEDESSGFFLRSLYPAEEFALFMRQRAWCLMDTARYDDTLFWCARALQFAPDDPNFPRCALMMADHGIKHRYARRYPDRKIPGPETPFNIYVDHLLMPEEMAFLRTIEGHHHESLGQLTEAQTAFEDARQHSACGNNELRDLQRFVRKHGINQKIERDRKIFAVA